MTRAEYLAELDSHLITLPREERDMAVNFYKEYFDEAGPEKEQEVIDELGKPYNLAKSIIGETSLYNKSEVYINYKASKPLPRNNTDVFVSLQKPGAFADQTPADTGEDIMPNRARAEAGAKAHEQDVMPRSGQNNTNSDPNIHFYGAGSSGDSNEQNQEQKSYNQNNNSNNEGNTSGMFDQYYNNGYEKASGTGYEGSYTNYSNKKRMSAGWIIFWVLITIFVIIPMVLPILITIPIVMLIIGIAAVVCIVAAIIAIVSGVVQMFVSIPTAIAYGAAGLLIAGLGFMMLSAALAFFFRFLPWTVKKIINFSRRRTA